LGNQSRKTREQLELVEDKAVVEYVINELGQKLVSAERNDLNISCSFNDDPTAFALPGQKHLPMLGRYQ